MDQSFEKYWFTEVCRIFQCWPFSLHNIPLFSITTNLTRKDFKHQKAVKFMVKICEFPKFQFLFQSPTFTVDNKTIICFPWNAKLTSFIFEQMSAKYQVWITSLPVSHSFQSKWYSMKKSSWLSFWLKQSHECVSWDNWGILLGRRSAFCMYRTSQKQIPRTD